MSSNLERYNKDLDKLISLGQRMKVDLHLRSLKQNSKLNKAQQKTLEKFEGTFESEYHNWYNQSFSIIKYLLPDRLIEFELFYKGEQKRKVIDLFTFTIQDWIMGARAVFDDSIGKKAFDDLTTTIMKFNTQLEILKSVKVKFESSLFDIKQLLQADLFDSEIDSSKELLKNGYLRASGVIAGVVLEAHLSQVCNNHNIIINKRNPTINDFNQALYASKHIDKIAMKHIDSLAAVGNDSAQEQGDISCFNPLKIGSVGNMRSGHKMHTSGSFNPLKIGSVGNRVGVPSRW